MTYGSQLAGESEEDCAERWRVWYGCRRGHQLADLYRKTHPNGALRGFYRTVSSLLDESNR